MFFNEREDSIDKRLEEEIYKQLKACIGDNNSKKEPIIIEIVKINQEEPMVDYRLEADRVKKESIQKTELRPSKKDPSINQLKEKIDRSLDNRNKEAFIHYSNELNKLRKRIY